MTHKTSILGRRRAEYNRLYRELRNVTLIARGNVFQIDPPADAPRAKTRYVWTRKVSGKTVTRALSAEQYAQMKEAIEEDRKLDNILTRMRSIVQDAIVRGSGINTNKHKA